MQYIPPENTNLPFVFTKKGYQKPTDQVVFNFMTGGVGNLSAAIQASQLHIDEAYTYVKSCPTYTVGYGSGAVQIIKGRCTYGGMRDLRSSVQSYHTACLNGYLTVLRVYQELGVSIGLHRPVDLGMSVKSLRFSFRSLASSISILSASIPIDIAAYAGGHLPSNVGAYLFAVGPVDLWARLGASYPKNLSFKIDTHAPSDIVVAVNGLLRALYGELASGIGLHLPDNLTSKISTHPFAQLAGLARAHLPQDIQGAVTGVLLSGLADLGGRVATEFPRFISSGVNGHLPSDLTSLMRLHFPESFYSSISGVLRQNFGDLGAGLSTHVYGNLAAGVRTHYPFGLEAKIKGHTPVGLYGSIESILRRAESVIGERITGITPINFSSLISVHSPEHLLGLLFPVQPVVLGSMIATHGPKNIAACVDGVFFGGMGMIGTRIGGHDTVEIGSIFAGHLPSEISGRVLLHGPRNIGASIIVRFLNPLTSCVFGWARCDTAVRIKGHTPVAIPAFIRTSFEGVFDLGMRSHVWQPLDIRSTLDGWGTSNLGVGMHGYGDQGILFTIGKHQPSGIRSTMRGWGVSDLGIGTYGYDERGILFKIGQHNPSGIRAILRGWGASGLAIGTHGYDKCELLFKIGQHQPSGIRSTVHGWDTLNLGLGVHGYGEQDILFKIRQHDPSDLNAFVRVHQTMTQDFPVYSHGWDLSLISIVTRGGHSPSDVMFAVFVNQRSSSVTKSHIRAWQVRSLSTYINTVFENSLSVYLLPLQPSNLCSYLRVRPMADIEATAFVWGTSPMRACLNVILYRNLRSSVFVPTRGAENVNSVLTGVAGGVSNLGLFLEGLTFEHLRAYLKAVLVSDLSGFLRPVPPRDLELRLHGWEERYILSSLTALEYPWDLTADIIGSGSLAVLSVSVFPVRNRYVPGDLAVALKCYEVRELPSEIISFRPTVLSCNIIPFGGSGDIHSFIKPKMIRLTTMVSVPTMSHKDLSAIINMPCFHTGYCDLRLSIYCKMKADLYSYIKAILFDYKTEYISSVIGDCDYTTVVDNYKLKVKILDGIAYTEDSYKLSIYVFAQVAKLGAYVRGTMQYRSLPIFINSMDLEKANPYERIKNRERVVRTDYAGVFMSHEIVEMSFRSVVKEYYYSSEGGVVWKGNLLDRWVMNVSSYIPASVALITKRKFHRAAELYDLSKFDTIDDAVKFMIDYVTEYPQADLGSSIINNGAFKTLLMSITPLYTRSSQEGLLGSISAVSPAVYVGVPDGAFQKYQRSL